jgi:hypothetical protein
MNTSCHNVELEKKNYQLRCALAIISSYGGKLFKVQQLL